MTKCKGCGKEFRKGVLAFLLTPKGMTGARVCQSCASGGALIVAPMLAPVVKQKTVRSDGVERALRQLRAYAAAARNIARLRAKNSESPGAEYFEAVSRADAFDGAIELLKRECGQ